MVTSKLFTVDCEYCFNNFMRLDSKSSWTIPSEYYLTALLVILPCVLKILCLCHYQYNVIFTLTAFVRMLLSIEVLFFWILLGAVDSDPDSQLVSRPPISYTNISVFLWPPYSMAYDA
jgi:hypothetical protein